MIAMVTAACGEHATSSPFSVHDSLGVHVAENSRSAWDSATSWSIGAQPSLTIGVENGDSWP
jgi:hypothetical protein